MAQLKDMRVRIASTKATQKITKAMQMVAASKLRRAQTAAEAARPYAEKMDRGDLEHRQRGRGFARRAGAARRHRQGSGASAAGLHRRARPVRRLQLLDRAPRPRARAVADQPGQGGQDSSASAARATSSSAAPSSKQIVEHVDLRSVRQLGFVNAEDIAKKVLARFEAGEFDVCTLFYSRFKSVISQIPTAQQIIPLVVEAPAANAGPATSYEYEPEEDEILTQLLPRNLAVQIFRALLENNASFYGAQMSAMDNATRNAGDMIRKQTLIYNRTRQAMITKELIEIISGAEAM